jgi:hypothetical protein
MTATIHHLPALPPLRRRLLAGPQMGDVITVDLIDEHGRLAPARFIVPAPGLAALRCSVLAADFSPRV